MKKRLGSLLLALVLCLGLTPAVSAAGDTTVVLKIGSCQMAVNTAVQQVDDENPAVIPMIENERTIVPVSRIVAAFGGYSTWDGPTQATTFNLNGKTVSHTVGTNVVTTPNGKKTMEVSSKIIQDRTYVPVRYVLEGLGLYVDYEPKNQLVVVSTASLSGKDLLSLPASKALLDAQTWNVLPISKYTGGTLVAPAVTRGSLGKYDTGTPSSVYVPDFGAATGYLLYCKKADYDYRRYDRADGVTWEQQLELLEAYMNALEALPNFRVLQPLSQDRTYKSYYKGALVYTGTGWVNDSVYDEYDGAHIYIQCNREWDHVMVYYDVGLKPVDTGLRLPGAGDLSNQLAAGPRLIDAYYKSGGAYYNSSDKQLSAKVGQCDVLINGTDRYTCSVNFQLNESYSTDEFAVTGLPRGDSLTLSFPHDYPMTGDVYTIQDFRRTTSFGYWRRLTEGNQTGIRLIHDGQFYYPEACQDSLVTAASARILQWDKSGDTVIYFYMEATVDGQPCRIEALAAAKWTEAESKPSSGSTGNQNCLTCRGSGNCTRCGGSGRVRNSMAGTGKWIEQNCTACGGSGDCRDCHGSGKR